MAKALAAERVSQVDEFLAQLVQVPLPLQLQLQHQLHPPLAGRVLDDEPHLVVVKRNGERLFMPVPVG